jgi:uncharacterized repeat protein (TIGR03803 family)
MLRRDGSRPSAPIPLEVLESRILFATNPPYPYAAGIFNFFNGTGVGRTGAVPEGLVMASNGDLYGVTGLGGQFGFGTVFKIAARTNTITTLASFANNVNADNSTQSGWFPMGNLVLDESSGHPILFGTTLHGGTIGDGTIFEFDTAATANGLTTLHSFVGGNDGSFPFDGLIQPTPGGTLYGTTYGTNGSFIDHPTVFQLTTPDTTPTYSVNATLSIYNHITGSIFLDGSGNIWGTTQTGGTSNFGTIFEIASGSHTATTTFNFNGTNGRAPTGSLLPLGGGKFIGFTANGGPINVGTIYTYDTTLAPAPTALTSVAYFNGTNGNRPIGLVAGPGSTFYGVTTSGTNFNLGTIFKFDLAAAQASTANATSSISILYYYTSANTGDYPTGPIVVDAAQRIFVDTYAGGPNNLGTITLYQNDQLVPQQATRIVWKQQPAPSVVAGHTSSSFSVVVQDALGRTFTSSSESVTVTISTGGVIVGTTTVLTNASTGTATFSGITLNKIGTYTLTVSDTNIPAVASPPSRSINVAADKATQLVVDPAQMPVPFGQAFVVKLEDQFGNVATNNSSARVTLTLPPLSGTKNVMQTVVARAGLASFVLNTTLVVGPGSYPYNATSGTLTPVNGTLQVGPAVTSLTIPTRASSYHTNQTISLTSILSSLAPGTLSYSGTLSIIDTSNGNATVPSSGTISGTSAKFVIAGTTLSAGTHNLVLKFTPNITDTFHAAGTSPAFSLVIVV